jgi:hypothetical protein
MGREVVGIILGKLDHGTASRLTTASSTITGPNGCRSRSSGSKPSKEDQVKARDPGFKKCMAMMRKRGPRAHERG